jgi:diguanylate cyclase (GGDEF)-like protein/PAS domain S-box-containing protein
VYNNVVSLSPDCLEESFFEHKMTNKRWYIRDAVERFFIAYLCHRNVEETIALVCEDLLSVGTGAQEMARNKEEFRTLVLEDIASSPTPTEFHFEDYTETSLSDTVVAAFFQMVITMPDETGNRVEIITRVITTFRRVDRQWKAATFHVSLPAVEQEECEYFPLKYADKQVRLARETQEQLRDLLLTSLPGGIFGFYREKDYPIYVINDEMLRCFGYTSEDFLPPTRKNLISCIHPADKQRVISSVRNTLRHSETYEFDLRLQKKDGSYLWAKARGRRIITDEGREVLLNVIIDISDAVRMQARLKEEASRDPLTQIYNRKTASTLVNRALKLPGQYALMVVDIDNFKSINDLEGHLEGDRILRRFANICLAHVKGEDVVARLGGDEFMIFLHGIRTPADAEKIGEKIRQQFCLLFEDYNQQLDLNLSIGGCLTSSSHQQFSDLYLAADTALYEVKNSGKGRCSVCFSSPPANTI